MMLFHGDPEAPPDPASRRARNNNPRIPETDSRDPEIEPCRLETEYIGYMIDWRQDNRGLPAAWWPLTRRGRRI